MPSSYSNSFPAFRFFALLALLFVLFSDLANAFPKGEEADSLIKNLVREDFGVSYEAEEVVIFFSGNEPTVQRYRLGILKPHKMKRTRYHISGNIEDVVVQDRDLRIEYYPNEKAIVRSPRHDDEVASTKREESLSTLIKANYAISVSGGSVVAGRSAVILSLTPKETGTRPSFKVWMDHETSLPLKTEIYSLNGKLSYLSSISGVVFDPSFPKDYFVIMVPEGTQAFDVNPPVPVAASADVKGVPPARGYPSRITGGFVLKEAREDGSGQTQFLYHDGLGTLSVFVEKREEGNQGIHDFSDTPMGDRIEKVKFGGIEGTFCGGEKENILRFRAGGEQVTIVGEISKTLLLDIAVAFKKKGTKK